MDMASKLFTFTFTFTHKSPMQRGGSSRVRLLTVPRAWHAVHAARGPPLVVWNEADCVPRHLPAAAGRPRKAGWYSRHVTEH